MATPDERRIEVATAQRRQARDQAWASLREAAEAIAYLNTALEDARCRGRGLTLGRNEVAIAALAAKAVLLELRLRADGLAD